MTVLEPFEGHEDVFATGSDGVVWSTSFMADGGWRPWFPIHPKTKMHPGAPVSALQPRSEHIDLFVTGTDGAVWSTFFKKDEAGWRPWFPIHSEVRMHRGAEVSALAPFEGHIDLFITGTDGTVWSTFFEDDLGGWQPWFTIHSEVKMRPGATVTVLQPFEGHVDLFVTGMDGTVWSTFFENDGGGWRPWFTIRTEVKMQPGAKVTALRPFEGHVDLYATGIDGTVWSTFFENGDGGWRPWFPIRSEVKMQRGATVTAVQPFDGHVDLFVTGVDGAVWSTFFENDDEGWRPWFPIHSEVKMQRGATVTAMKPFEGHIDLYVTGTDGAVWSAFFENDAGGWRGWMNITNEPHMQPGATVTTLVAFDGHVDLFVTGTDGAVWSTFFEGHSDWARWFTIHAEVKMQPGATITALQPFEGHVDLFVTGTDGAVWSTFFENDGGGWRPWFTIHAEVRMQPGSTVTALQPFEGHVDLFVTGTDGSVWSTFFEKNGGWSPWFLVRGHTRWTPRMKPGATVTALRPFEGHVDLFVTGTDGSVWSTFFENDNVGWRQWFTIHSETKMQPGATVTALQPFEGHVDLFATGTDGAVWSTFFDNNGGGWQPWFVVHTETRMRPGASVTALQSVEGHVDLFAAGNDGTLWSTYFESEGGWRNWTPLNQPGSIVPGSTASALLGFEDHLGLFVTGVEGTVWATYLQPGRGWLTWFTIHAETKMRAGSTVTAIQPFKGHVDLFANDGNGVVWSTFFESVGGWRDWFALSPNRPMYPGATVTVLQPFEGHVDLFVTGPDGVVWSAFFDNDSGGWKPWFPIHSEVKMQRGATITALQPFDGHVDLFVTGLDGTVWSTFFDNDDDGWRPWFPIHAEAKMQPGAVITALQPFEGHVDLFATGTDGTVWSTFFEQDNGGWQPWFPIHAEVKMKPGATVTAWGDSFGVVLYAVDVGGIIWRTGISRNGGWASWLAMRPELQTHSGATPTLAGGKIYVLSDDGAVWSSSSFNVPFGSPAGLRETLQWRPWQEINAGYPMDPRGVVTVQILDDSSEDEHAEHTNVFVTGSDGAVWSTFWKTKDESRIVRPNTPFWSPGENGYAGGVGSGPGGGYDEEDDGL